jgi:hypothetical protein
MAVPYTFATATSSIPLSQLDSNFATGITLGNTTVYLGNTTTSFGNVTLTNATISSVATTFPNSFLANSSVTIGSTNVSLGGTAATIAGLTLTSPTINGGTSTATQNLANVTGTLAVGNGGTGLVSLSSGYIPYGNGTSAFSSNANLTFNGTTLSTNTLNAVTFNINNGNNGTLSGQSYYAGFNQPIAELDFYNSASSLSNKNIAYIQGWIGNNNNVGVITFNAANGSNATEIARFTGAGYLGIGTSSPSKYLHVKGTNDNVAYFDVASGATYTTAYFANNGTSYAVLDWNNSSNWFELGTLGTNPIRFITNNTEAMRLDSSGNLGLGVTPSTSGGLTNQKTLEIGGVGNSLFNNSTNAFWMGQNVIYNSNYKYATTAASSFYLQTAGSHQWNIAPSGTAGNAITFTQAMTLDNSGNLLVGTTTTLNVATSGNYISSGTASYIGTGHASGTANGSSYTAYYYNATYIGGITQNGTTGVLYNLTSDYRLKNNPTALTGASEFIMALQPKTWDWWDGSGKGVGFIAHEFMEVAKYSGNGTKDEVDVEGNPVYQSIQPSSSEVMANLVALVQEQQAIIEQLKQKVGI